MKVRIYLVVACLLSSFIGLSQTYSFTKLVKKASVETSSGDQYRTLSTTPGIYQFVFEKHPNEEVKLLFTLLNPGQVDGPGLPWFALLEEGGYIEKNGKLLKKNVYFDTEKSVKVAVLIADDYSMIVILRPDNTVWEYIK